MNFLAGGEKFTAASEKYSYVVHFEHYHIIKHVELIEDKSISEPQLESTTTTGCVLLTPLTSVEMFMHKKVEGRIARDQLQTEQLSILEKVEMWNVLMYCTLLEYETDN